MPVNVLSRTIATPSGCLEWQGGISNGYGKVWNGKKVVFSHRQSWIQNRGEIPLGQCVLHRCDNRKCVNPEHLFLGTYQDNHDDMWRKGRKIPKKGQDASQAVLTDNHVIIIRDLHKRKCLNGTQLADLFSVSRGAIYALLKNRTWRHLNNGTT